MTFGRLADIDFDECHCLLIYFTVLYLDFARWSVLDGVDSRILVKLLVTCILVVSFLGVLEWIFFWMPEEYIMVEHAVDRSLRVSRRGVGT